MQFIYFKLYKPYGYLSQFTKEIDGHFCLSDLPYSIPTDVYPIGRLDKDSEGLLLLSNDKSLVDRILNPKSELEKTYWVQVEGIPDLEDLKKLQDGVTIKVKTGKYHKTLPCTAKLINPTDIPERDPPIRKRLTIPTSWCEIKISEGKNRQVRKMFAKIGYPVLRLIRTKIGNISVSEMNIGELRTFKKTDL